MKSTEFGTFPCHMLESVFGSKKSDREKVLSLNGT